jgi:spore coat polysaccharide biosynthesis protein SpsF
VVVATTDQAADDPIVELCEQRGWAVFRGEEKDLLDRHYQASLSYQPDAVVKIPSDCPLIDPKIIDEVISRFLQSPDLDYVSNLHPATHPDGNDVEVIRWGALESAWREADKDFEREHTTPFLWERPERFRLANIALSQNLSQTHRCTIDYPEDYQLIRAVAENLAPKNPLFSWQDVVAFLNSAPHLQALNEKYRGVNWYRNHLHELKTISAEETRVI